MRAFTDLYTALDETNKTNEKVEAMRRYFSSAPLQDAAEPRSQAEHGERARGIIRGRIQRPLRCEDHPETTIQPALVHARQVNMRAIHIEVAALREVVLRRVEIGGRVEVAVEHHQALMKRTAGRLDRRCRGVRLFRWCGRDVWRAGREQRGRQHVEDTFHGWPRFVCSVQTASWR